MNIKMGAFVTMLMGMMLAPTAWSFSWEEIEDARHVYMSNPTTKEVAGHAIPMYQIGVWEHEGELVSWLEELAPLLQDISSRTQWEVCGVIQSTPQGHRLEVYSNGSALFCSPPPTQGVLLHTHPPMEAVTTTPWERSLGWGLVAVLDPYGFSDQDLSMEEGWLVMPNGQLWHQTYGQAHAHLAWTRALLCPKQAFVGVAP